MKCLYTTTTEYNYKEFKRYNWTLFFARGKLAAPLFFELAVLAIGIFAKKGFLLLAAIAYPVIIIGMQMFRIRKAYKAAGAPKKLTVTYEFYETEVVERMQQGAAHFPYAKLHSIVETKTNFYVMVSASQCLVLCKRNFPEGLSDFVRGMIPNGQEMSKLK